MVQATYNEPLKIGGLCPIELKRPARGAGRSSACAPLAHSSPVVPPTPHEDS
jgi:hypothetical protein